MFRIKVYFKFFANIIAEIKSVTLYVQMIYDMFNLLLTGLDSVHFSVFS
jgi:hypothetical protein